MFGLTACHPPESQQDHPTTAGPISVVTPDARQEPVTMTSPFAPTSASISASKANSYQELLRRFPEAHQELIKAWYASHAQDSMHFGSNAQWQWLQQHDYPTPDDVLQASVMTDAQLRELAANGDTKANFFYLARLLDDYTQANTASTTPTPHKAQLQSDLIASMDRALASGSSFAGYLFIPYYTALHGKQTTGVATAAGLMWADSFGDSNGLFHSRLMAFRFRGVSGVQTAEVYFDMFATAARANPYFKNTYRGRGELFMPVQ